MERGEVSARVLRVLHPVILVHLSFSPEGFGGGGWGLGRVGLGGPQGIGVFTRMLHLNEVRCGPALFIYLCCHETRLLSSSEEVANAVAALGVSKR